MASQVQVSIIIPVYNAGELLRRSVRSVLAQSHRDWELILVNNGSRDHSGDICREYAAEYPDRIRYLELAQADVSVARNAGLDMACGEWVYFSDADDEVLPDALSHLLELALRNDADISTAALRCTSSATEDVRTNFPFADGEVLTAEAIRQRWLRPLLRLQPSSAVVHGYLPISLLRRSLIEEQQLRFIPRLTVTQDEAFFFELLPSVRKVATSTKVVYHYIANPNSSCARHFKKRSVSFANLERCWYLRWDCRLRVLRRYNLTAVFPGAEALLYVNRAYHLLQMLLSDEKLSWRERWQRCGQALQELQQDEVYGVGLQNASLSRGQRLFMLAVRWGRLFVIPGCLLARVLKRRRPLK
ncbi:MAG: glycosyltransferase [Lentisphaerae bacterium]|nr:glycosyltransferase [Lentisphaerota bacterium]